MDCSPPGSSVHGILQTRILGWVAISLSRESSQPNNQTQVSHTAGRFFTVWATREACYLLTCAKTIFLNLQTVSGPKVLALGASQLINDLGKWSVHPGAWHLTPSLSNYLYYMGGIDLLITWVRNLSICTSCIGLEIQIYYKVYILVPDKAVSWRCSIRDDSTVEHCILQYILYSNCYTHKM